MPNLTLTLTLYGGEDCIVKIWKAIETSIMKLQDSSRIHEDERLETVTPHIYLRAHKTPLAALAFSADGQGLATCAESGNVRLWDWRKENCMYTMSASSMGVKDLAFSADCARLATVCEGGQLKIWLSNRFVPAGIIESAHEGVITSVAICPMRHTIDPKHLGSIDSSYKSPFVTVDPVEILITTSLDGTVKIWDSTAIQNKFKLEQFVAKHDKTAIQKSDRLWERELERKRQAIKTKATRISEMEAERSLVVDGMAYRERFENAKIGLTHDDTGPRLMAHQPTPKRDLTKGLEGSNAVATGVVSRGWTRLGIVGGKREPPSNGELHDLGYGPKYSGGGGGECVLS